MEREFREKINLVFENLLAPFPIKQKNEKSLTLTTNEFSEESSAIFGSNQKTTTLTEDHLRNLFFGDFMKSKDEVRFYDEISDLEALKKVSMEFIVLKNHQIQSKQSGIEMKICFFFRQNLNN